MCCRQHANCGETPLNSCHSAGAKRLREIKDNDPMTAERNDLMAQQLNTHARPGGQKQKARLRSQPGFTHKFV